MLSELTEICTYLNWLRCLRSTHNLTLITFTGVTLYGGPRASTALGLPEVSSFHHEYSSMACTVEIVDDVRAAIDHIHRHGRQARDVLLLFFPFLTIEKYGSQMSEFKQARLPLLLCCKPLLHGSHTTLGIDVGGRSM